MSKIYDALIIGAGPAGLSAALVFGRVHRTCAIFATEAYRNDGAHASHAILTRDHTPPAEIRALGRKDLERYRHASFFETKITQITRKADGPRRHFVAKDASSNEWKGRTVIMATGVHDVLPALPGYKENWPESIYQCPVCDGHERSNGPVGVLCYPNFTPAGAHVATVLHFLSQPVGTSIDDLANIKSNVTIFTNGPVDSQDPSVSSALELFKAHNMTIDQRQITHLEPSSSSKPGLFVHLQPSNSDTSAPIKVFQNFLFHKPSTMPNATDLIEQLNLELTTTPFGQHVSVTAPFNSTNVPGLFVAGDAGVMLTQATLAISSGVTAAAGAMSYIGGLDNEIALARWKDQSTSSEKEKIEVAEVQRGVEGVVVS